jgi:hypothetical protein
MCASLTWREIPGHFDFADVYREAVANAVDGARFVEIGTLFGKSACFMAEAIRLSGKRIAFDTIDPFKWSMHENVDSAIRVLEPRHNPATPIDLWATLLSKPDLHAAARYCIEHAGCESHVNLICASGQEQVCHYLDRSLDFVFIDAKHTYGDTTTLLQLYLPKMRPSAVLAGHDYNSFYPGVVRAVADVLGSVETRGNCFLYRCPLQI